jgi:hypothetical protein
MRALSYLIVLSLLLGVTKTVLVERAEKPLHRSLEEIEQPSIKNAYMDRKKISSYRKGKHGTAMWSVLLPVLSMSFLSWFVRNGRRCCTYDEGAVLDDIVHCEFRTEEPTQENNNVSEDIELQSVIPTSKDFFNNMSRQDPVRRLSVLDCSCIEAGEGDHHMDSSFSWMEKDLPNANYLYLED